MSKKNNEGKTPTDAGFGSIDDDFFSEGEGDAFWTDEEKAAAASADAQVSHDPFGDLDGFVPGDDDPIPGDEDPIPGDDAPIPGDTSLPYVDESLFPTAEELMAAEATDAGIGAVAEATEPEPAVSEPAVADSEPSISEPELPKAEPEVFEPETVVQEAEPVLAAAASEQADPTQFEMDDLSDEYSYTDTGAGLGGKGLEPTTMSGADNLARAPIFQPSEGESGAWRDAVQTLTQEASATDGELSAQLTLEAARICRARLGDVEQSLSLLRSLPRETPGVLPQLVDTLSMAGDWEGYRDALIERAGGEADHVTAAELLQDAALLVRQRIGNGTEVRDLLNKSITKNKEDYFSLQLMLEYAVPNSDWNLAEKTLSQMGELVAGARAAAFHYQRGRILVEQLARLDEGILAFKDARSSSIGHVSTFIALEGLLGSAGRFEELATLYGEESERLEGSDSWIYMVHKARTLRDGVKDPVGAKLAFESAIELGAPLEVRREFQSHLERNSEYADLVEAIKGEFPHLSENELKWSHMRCGRAMEQAGDLSGALEVYVGLAQNPSNKPASESAARIFRRTENYAGLLEFWKKRSRVVSDPELRVTLAFRMGELCESKLQDHPEAKSHYERILDLAPNYGPALEALERVYTRLEEWSGLAAIYEQRSDLATTDNAKALHLHRAASIFENRLGDLVSAVDLYKRALGFVPDFPPSLDACKRILLANETWEDLASVLTNAAVASNDESVIVGLYYRAARVYAERIGNVQLATEHLKRCLELSPGFLPAHNMLKELSVRAGMYAELMSLQVVEANSTEDQERRQWLLLDAAELSVTGGLGEANQFLESIRSTDPENPGAMRFLTMRALADRNFAAYADLLEEQLASNDGERASQISAQLLSYRLRGDDQGAISRAANRAVEKKGDASCNYLARTCEIQGEPAAALAALNGSGVEAARILDQYLGSQPKALEIVRGLLKENAESDAALMSSLQLEQVAGSREGLAETHRTLADCSLNSPVKVVHATLAGHLLEGAGRSADALGAYKIAWESRPSRGKAWDALRRLYIESKQIDKLSELMKDASPVEIALDMMSAGEPKLAAEALDAADTTHEMVWLVVALEAAENWERLYEVLNTLHTQLNSEEQRSSVEAKIRWVLAEKLPHTDEAWEEYSRLHEEYPDDVSVIEALAGIARARNEPKLSIQYMLALSELAQDASDKSEFLKKAAIIQRTVGDTDGARSSWMSALDYSQEDRESLCGLRELAEEEGDHRAVVGVLAREAAISEGNEKVELHSWIARVWEEKIEDSNVATEAWRKVLELEGENITALERLSVLTKEAGDWTGFVDYSSTLIGFVDGEAKSSLCRQVGMAIKDHIKDEARAIQYLQMAVEGPDGDLQAAVTLEKIFTIEGEMGQVVSALHSQGSIAEGEVAVKALEKAVALQLSPLGDIEGAAQTWHMVLAIDKSHAEALAYLSEHMYQAGDFNGAIPLYAERELQSDSWDLDDFDEQIEISLFYYHYASALVNVGDSELAKERLVKALDLNPSHLPSLIALGPLQIASGEWKKAEQIYRQLLKHTGGTGDKELLASTYAHLGRVEYALGKTDKAAKRFKKALGLEPNSVPAMLGMAELQFESEDWNGLFNSYNTVIRYASDPGAVIKAYVVKGHVLDVAMNLPDKAAQHYQKAWHYYKKSNEATANGGLSSLAENALLRLTEMAIRMDSWEDAIGILKDNQADQYSDNVGLALAKAVAEGMSGDEGGGDESLAAVKSMDSDLKKSIGKAKAGSDKVRGLLQSLVTSNL